MKKMGFIGMSVLGLFVLGTVFGDEGKRCADLSESGISGMEEASVLVYKTQGSATTILGNLKFEGFVIVEYNPVTDKYGDGSWVIYLNKKDKTYTSTATAINFVSNAPNGVLSSYLDANTTIVNAGKKMKTADIGLKSGKVSVCTEFTGAGALYQDIKMWGYIPKNTMKYNSKYTFDCNSNGHTSLATASKYIEEDLQKKGYKPSED